MSCCSSVAKSCPTLCDPVNCSMAGFSVHHYLPEFAQTHVHWVGDAIQPSLLPSSPAAFSLSQRQGLFQWVSFSRQVVKVLEIPFVSGQKGSEKPGRTTLIRCKGPRMLWATVLRTGSVSNLPWWSWKKKGKKEDGRKWELDSCPTPPTLLKKYSWWKGKRL